VEVHSPRRAVAIGGAILVGIFMLLAAWALSIHQSRMAMDFASTGVVCATTGVIHLLTKRRSGSRGGFRIDSMRQLVIAGIVMLVLIIPIGVISAYTAGAQSAWIEGAVFMLITVGAFVAGWLRLRRRGPT
jgi:hypothetical protein